MASSALNLKEKQRQLRSDFPETLALRVHRAISWLQRSEDEEKDPDVCFILLWIGFNAAYAAEIDSEISSERSSIKTYFDMLVSKDSKQHIYNAVWKRYSQEIRLLLNNKYVFSSFWNHQNGLPGYDDWEARLARSQSTISAALTKRDTALILVILFDRLYVLRNQLVHGGATWNSAVNRDQVRDGAAVMAMLLPVFIDIMMDNSDLNWGKPFYPVLKQ